MKKNRDGILLSIGLLTAVIPTVLLFMSVTYLFAATLATGIVATVLGFSNPSKVRRISGISVCTLSVVGSFGLIAYASSSGYPIKPIIPNDFTGEIRIHLDEQNGTPPERTEDYWVYRIGDDGALLTTNVKPFYRWHQTRAEFRDGRVILDYASDIFQNHGYKLEGGGTSITGNDPNPTHHWTLTKLDANKSLEATATSAAPQL